jgi:hypothetical protein
MSRIRADQLVNRAGSGGPKFPNGVAEGFSVSGVVTATSYRGDGSQLTGIDASSLKDGSNVKVQATATGATVTGTLVADVSGNITSSGANTLGSLTVSNDATVQGNLTVNGTTTTIDTAVTAVDTLQVDGNVAIGTDTTYTNNSFTSLSVGGNAKFGLLELKKSDGVAGSWIDCYGTGGNGDLRITTAGTSGAITFWTGGSFTEKVRITSSGNVGINSTSPVGALDVGGNIFPAADNTHDLGSASKRWANIYTGDLNLSNKGSANDVDGTWGQYTIQEGEDDLFLINRRTGKKYKFNLTEVN